MLASVQRILPPGAEELLHHVRLTCVEGSLTIEVEATQDILVQVHTGDLASSVIAMFAGRQLHRASRSPKMEPSDWLKVGRTFCPQLPCDLTCQIPVHSLQLLSLSTRTEIDNGTVSSFQ
jgi:hypothetical protein